MTDTATALDGLTTLGTAVDHLDRGLLGIDGDTSVLDVMQVLAELRAHVERLQKIDAALVRHLYLHAEHGEHDYDGIGRARVYRTRASEKWDGRGAAVAAVSAQLEAAGGEIPEPFQIVAWVLDVVGISYARKGALRALGLDPDNYYDSVPGKPRVDLPRGDAVP